MTGLSESALNPDLRPDLVISTNWIGDCIMSFPAVRNYRERNPHRSLHVICRPHLKDLWEMSGLADTIYLLPRGLSPLLKLSSQFTERFEAAYIFPNSIRSGLAARLSGAPVRIGLRGHQRKWLLTKTVQIPDQALDQHQCWETFYLLGLDVPGGFAPLPQVQLKAVADDVPEMAELLKTPGRLWTGLIPCAARGPSKEWPESKFLELGISLLKEENRGIVFFGGPGDGEKCQRMAESLDGPVLNLAGKTSMRQWAACLSCCQEVVANDSGGMHLAAALHIPVIGIFGITDPGKTGPLGPFVRIIQESEVAARDIPRKSEGAQACLSKISAERVKREILELRKCDKHEEEK